MFTKEEISHMKEAEFQTRVVIPLFRAMKFKDVTDFGGGNLEVGKDVVMWTEGLLKQRLNCGLVIKSVRVDGKAEGNTSATNVLNQVRQCLASKYPNPVTGEEMHIHRCFVICSHDITKEAMNSIEGQLNEGNLNKLVEWVHPGTNLFQLIDEFLPQQGIFEKLAEVQRELDESTKDTPYKLVADSGGGVSILAKHDKASEEMPFEIKGNFTFDTSTEEGKEALEKLKNHFEKGIPVEIEGKHIEFLKFPDFLPLWMKPHVTPDAKLELIPIPPDHIVPWRIERKLASGEVLILDRIDLKVIYPGTREITLTNHEQSVPWKFVFVVNLETRQFKYEFFCKWHGYNVAQHLQALKFRLAMSQEGETSLYDATSGLKLVDADKEILELNADIKLWIDVLEALIFIQEKTATLLIVPEVLPTMEQVDEIFRTANIIKSGKVVASTEKIKIPVLLNKAKEYINNHVDEKVDGVLVSHPDWNVNIFDSVIDLGVNVAHIAAYITKEDFRTIEENIQAGLESVDFLFTPVDKAFIIDFLQWECADRDSRYLFTDEEAS
jgi:hypothetical protein